MAMPTLMERIGAWQRETGATPQRTTLIGFSQGAIMALESTQQPSHAHSAARVIEAIGRRMGTL